MLTHMTPVMHEPEAAVQELVRPLNREEVEKAPEMSPGALKAVILTIGFLVLYLAVTGAWLWSSVYRFQDCL